jgi:hypothetical protein
MNEVFPLERATEAYDHMMSVKAKFRCVLTTGNYRELSIYYKNILRPNFL